jgi:hypothetical protein
MAWQNPKTDWKAGDVPAASDFNRIEGNTQEVKDEIGSVSGGLDAHKSDYMPHIFNDNGTTYRWGFRTVNGQPQFIYEEVW